jgi:hypothetical protein
MRMGRRLAAAALALMMTLQPLAAMADGFQYFRMYGHTGFGAPGTGVPVSQTFSFTIVGPSAVSVGHVATFTTVVQNARGATTFDVLSGSLPAGVVLNPSTGAISGVTSSLGNFSAIIHGADASGQEALANFSLAVVNDFGISGAPSTSTTAGKAYEAIFTAFGGDQPYRFSAAGLPPGLSLVPGTTTAAISGTPTTSDNYDITVTAMDVHNLQATKSFRLSVSPHLDLPLTVSGNGGGTVQADTSYSAAFIAAGGAGGYVWSAQGTLPPGLSMDPASGVLSGTPTTPGVYAGLRAVVTDQASHSASSGAFSITVFGALAASWNPPTSYQTGDTVSAAASATGGSGSYSWSLDGVLPTGVSLNSSTGAISGQATAPGTYGPIKLTVTDGTRTAQTSSVTFTVADPPPLAIASPSVPSGQIGQPFPATAFTASGGHPSYTFAVSGSSSSLPPGMSLDANGVLSGTPQNYYDETIKITATDQAGATAVTGPFRLHILGPLTIYGTPVQFITRGEFYQATQPRASGGTEQGYIYDLPSGILPDGLTLNGSTGFISGVPTELGSFDRLRVRVTDSDGNQAYSPEFSIVVQPSADEVPPVQGYAADTFFPSRAVVGAPTLFTIQAFGGHDGPYRYAANPAIPLPTGLSVDPDSGIVTGTPTTQGVYPISIVITDVSQSDNITGYANVGNLVVLSFAISADPGFGRVGMPYNMPFTVAGGSGNVTFSLGSGSLPAGLSLGNSTGIITGTPTEAGTWNVTVLAHDNVSGKTAESPQTPLQVAAVANVCYSEGTVGPGAEVGLGIMGSTFVAGAIDVSQLQGFRLNWSDSGHDPDGFGDPLPPGVQWYYFGAVAGAPTQTGIYGPIVVTVEDNLGGSGPCGAGSASPVFMVESIAPVQLDTTSLPSGTAGQPYTATLSASSGKPGYWYSIAIDQSLPPSLTLNQSTGVISGVTQMRGTFPLDMTVTDAWGFQAIRSMTLTIN